MDVANEDQSLGCFHLEPLPVVLVPINKFSASNARGKRRPTANNPRADTKAYAVGRPL